MFVSRSHHWSVGVTLIAGLALVAGCGGKTSSASSSGSAASGAQPTVAGSPNGGAQQTIASPTSSGPTCSIDQTKGTKVDLHSAIVGFSQSEAEENPFRIEETKSIEDEAAKFGVKKLLTTNAGGQLSKQISDIEDMLAQGAQLLIVAPLNSDGLQPAFDAAKAKGVPVLTIDRKVTSPPCDTWVTFIGSDFVQQGTRAADALAKAMNNQGNVAILLGSSGNNVTTSRTNGFTAELAKAAPNIKIVAQQTGDFKRSTGKDVMAQLIQSHPEINGVYAENDEMAIGAVTALKGAGKNPGSDIKVASIDGTHNAVADIVSGQINAVIESNPRFGPLAFKSADDFESGKPIPQNVVISDNAYDQANASSELQNTY